MIEIYVDGACSGNPGPGGWAVIFKEGGEYSGYIHEATNNIAELEAVYQALVRLNNNERVVIYTDSQVVIGWLQENYMINFEHILIKVESIKTLIKDKNLNLILKKVAGHSGDFLNERADKLARGEIRKRKTPRYL